LELCKGDFVTMTHNPGGIWRPNTPDTLLDLTTRFCLHNPHVFTEKLACGSLVLQDNLHLPVELCEQFLKICHQEGKIIDDDFANIFSDFQNSRLKQLSLVNSTVSDIGMKCLLGHNLKTISLMNCSRLTSQTLESINETSDTLVSLSIVDLANIENSSLHQVFPEYLDTDYPEEDDFVLSEDDEREENIYEKRRYILRAPRLRNLTVRDLYIGQGREYLNILFKALPNLTHLDLSGILHSQGLQKFRFLLNCPNLVSLILHNVKEVKSSLPTLTQLDRLEHLDISQVHEPYGEFPQPALFLEELVKNLPRLQSLDISGTNLATEYKDVGGRCDGMKCDIPGLNRRIDSPLEFLGLYATKDEACRREHIPARNVTGNHTEAQILLAGRRYIDRPNVMESLIDNLVNLVRREHESDVRAALDITVTCMERHPREKTLQRHASALLYFLLPLLKESNLGFNKVVRQRLLTVLLGVMRRYQEDSVLMRNGCMVLWRFDPPQDLLSQYPAVVDILLFIGEYYSYSGDGDNYTQRAAVFLLNSLVCQVDGEQKKVRGLEIVDGMLRVVKQKLGQSLCDEVMETAWSVMWNVTDETPANSQRFLDKSGMELFLQCKEAFPNTMDLLRNMMGLLGNIAEVKECRKRLMSTAFVNEFSFLLDSSKDGIEVSYNAAGVLSHLASDGSSAWVIQEPSRDHVLEKLVRAVTRWDVNARRDINYRSLSPIIGLLACDHTPECQLWASWALANLTQWEEAKYCPLVDREGGLTAIRNILLREVDFSPSPVRDKLIALGKMAVRNIETWRRADIQVDVMVRD